MLPFHTGLTAPLLHSEKKQSGNVVRIFISMLFLISALIIYEVQHYKRLRVYLSESGDILHRPSAEKPVGSFSAIINDLVAVEKKKQDLRRTGGGVTPFIEAPLPLTCDKQYKKVTEQDSAKNFGCDNFLRFNKDQLVSVGNTLKKPDIYGMCHDYLYLKTIGSYGVRYYMIDIRYWAYNIWPIPASYAEVVEKPEFTKQNNWAMGGGWMDVSQDGITFGQIFDYVQELAEKQAYVVKTFNCWDYINQFAKHFFGDERSRMLTYGLNNRLYNVKLEEQKRGFRFKKYFPWMDQYGSTVDEYIKNYFEPRYPPIKPIESFPKAITQGIPGSPPGTPRESDGGKLTPRGSEETPRLKRVNSMPGLESPRVSNINSIKDLQDNTPVLTPRLTPRGNETPRSTGSSPFLTPRSTSDDESVPFDLDLSHHEKTRDDPFSELDDLRPLFKNPQKIPPHIPPLKFDFPPSKL